MGVSAESVTVAMIVIVAMRVVMHQLDFNRDSLARTARIQEDTATSQRPVNRAAFHAGTNARRET